MNRLLLAALALALSSAAFAQTSAVPTLINYQGRVADAAGLPIGNTTPANRIVVFRIWDHPTATAALNRLYSEQQNVTISAGEFSVLVGAGTAVSGETGNAFTVLNAAVFTGATRYLGVTIDDGNGDLSNDLEASPRQQIVTSAFAFRAQVAESVAAGGIASSTAFAANAVGSAALATGAVTTLKLADGAVDTLQLKDLGVTAGKLAAGAVTDGKLAANAVLAGAIKDKAVETAKLDDLAVTKGKLAGNSVDSSKIENSSIIGEDLAAGAVDSGQLKDGAVINGKIYDLAVTTGKLADLAVIKGKLAGDSVDSSKIENGSIALVDLSSSVQDGLPKPRHIYNQAVFDTPTADPKGHTLIPIDVGDLGNDVDGCRVQIIGFHRTSITNTLLTEHKFFLQQTGFTKADANFPDTYAWLVWQTVTLSFGVADGQVRLPPAGTSAGDGGTVFANTNNDNWVRFYNYYPGSLRSGEVSPYNTNRDPALIGPPLTLNILSVQAGTNKLTITVDNPHAIQPTIFPSGVPTGTVTLTGISGGSPVVPATALNVIEVPSRTSFVVTHTGASGTYSLSQAKVTYNPIANRYRLWAAVHPSVSARIIVSDR